jgi:hypothetical protein
MTGIDVWQAIKPGDSWANEAFTSIRSYTPAPDDRGAVARSPISRHILWKRVDQAAET